MATYSIGPKKQEDKPERPVFKHESGDKSSKSRVYPVVDPEVRKKRKGLYPKREER